MACTEATFSKLKKRKNTSYRSCIDLAFQIQYSILAWVFKKCKYPDHTPISLTFIFDMYIHAN